MPGLYSANYGSFFSDDALYKFTFYLLTKRWGSIIPVCIRSFTVTSITSSSFYLDHLVKVKGKGSV